MLFFCLHRVGKIKEILNDLLTFIKMKKKTLMRAIVLSLTMVLMLLSAAVHAQSDDFFRNDGDYTNRSNEVEYNITNQTFGQEPAPLGSGLLILTAIGAGYAAMRRKR